MSNAFFLASFAANEIRNTLNPGGGVYHVQRAHLKGAIEWELGSADESPH